MTHPSPGVSVGTLEALLFASGEALSFTKIATLLHLKKQEVRALVRSLAEQYASTRDGGLMLIEHDEQVELATKPEYAPILQEFTKGFFQERLSKAALEVLAIIAYRSPITRSSIEAIRGVNCSFTIRNLLLRGLIDRKENPTDMREYVYSPAFLLLEKFGIGSLEALPDYAKLSRDERLERITEELAPVADDVQSPM